MRTVSSYYPTNVCIIFYSAIKVSKISAWTGTTKHISTKIIFKTIKAYNLWANRLIIVFLQNQKYHWQLCLKIRTIINISIPNLFINGPTHSTLMLRFRRISLGISLKPSYSDNTPHNCPFVAPRQSKAFDSPVITGYYRLVYIL